MNEITSNNVGPRRPLTTDELAKLKETFNTLIASDDPKTDLVRRNYTLVFMLLHTGLRISEILPLKVKDVYLFNKVSDNIIIREFKVKRTRNILMNDQLKSIIGDHLFHYGFNNNPDQYLFFSRNGSQISTRQASNIFKNIFNLCEFTGLLGTHTCRKTFAKKMLESSGNSIPLVQNALGHRSVKSTFSYISANSETLSKLMNEYRI